MIVGARSGLFAPLQNLGLIVLDEEHDPSFKQNNTPYYDTRRVAMHYAQLAHATSTSEVPHRRWSRWL